MTVKEMMGIYKHSRVIVFDGGRDCKFAYFMFDNGEPIPTTNDAKKFMNNVVFHERNDKLSVLFVTYEKPKRVKRGEDKYIVGTFKAPEKYAPNCAVIFRKKDRKKVLKHLYDGDVKYSYKKSQNLQLL